MLQRNSTKVITKMSLSNKVAIVTGGSSGIGAAIAVKFAAEGAKVAIVGRNEFRLAAVAKDIEKNHSKPLVIAADVTKEEDANRIVEDTIKRFGKIDILVNNAGIARVNSILDSECMKAFDEVLNTNLRSVVHLTHLAAAHLVETKGNIINISSAASMTVLTYTNGFIYCTSKAGMDHFSRCIAIELAEKGVRVNCINPGPVKTNIFESEAEIEKIIENTALKRAADAEEVADLTAFVASDKGRSITGSALVTDNGYLLI